METTVRIKHKHAQQLIMHILFAIMSDHISESDPGAFANSLMKINIINLIASPVTCTEILIAYKYL